MSVEVATLTAKLEADASGLISGIKTSIGQLDALNAKTMETSKALGNINDRYDPGPLIKKLNQGREGFDLTGHSVGRFAAIIGSVTGQAVGFEGAISGIISVLGKLGPAAIVAGTALATYFSVKALQNLMDNALAGKDARFSFEKLGVRRDEERAAYGEQIQMRASLLEVTRQNKLAEMDAISSVAALRRRASDDEIGATNAERDAKLKRLDSDLDTEKTLAGARVAQSKGTLQLATEMAAVEARFAAQRVRVNEEADNAIRASRIANEQRLLDTDQKVRDAATNLLSSVASRRAGIRQGTAGEFSPIGDIATLRATRDQAWQAFIDKENEWRARFTNATSAAPRIGPGGPQGDLLPNGPMNNPLPGGATPGQQAELDKTQAIIDGWNAARAAYIAYQDAQALANKEAERPRLLEGLQKVADIQDKMTKRAEDLAVEQERGVVGESALFRERERSVNAYRDQLQALISDVASEPAVVAEATKLLNKANLTDFAAEIQKSLGVVRQENNSTKGAIDAITGAIRKDFPAAALEAIKALGGFRGDLALTDISLAVTTQKVKDLNEQLRKAESGG